VALNRLLSIAKAALWPASRRYSRRNSARHREQGGRARLAALVPVYAAALLAGAGLTLSGRALAQYDPALTKPLSGSRSGGLYRPPPARPAQSAAAAKKGARAARLRPPAAAPLKRPGAAAAENTGQSRQGTWAKSLKRKFINSGVLRPNIKPPPRQEPDFPAFSTAVFVPKFFDSHERFERVDLSSASRLRFAATVDFFPFNYSDKNDILAGYNIDLVRALCAELRVENICQIEAVPWEELEQRLQNGSVDALIAGIAPNTKNRNFLRFSRAYMRFPARFIALRGSAVQKDSRNFMRLGYDFSEFLMLRGASLRVGVVHNTAHEKILADYFTPQKLDNRAAENRAAAGKTMQLVAFADKKELLAGLKAKKIDLAFGDGMSFALMMSAEAAAAQTAALAVRPAAARQTGAPVNKAPAAPAAIAAAAARSGKAAESCCLFIGGAYMGIGYLGQGMRIAAAENNPRLINALNYALQQLERKGKLAELYLRYFPVGFY